MRKLHLKEFFSDRNSSINYPWWIRKLPDECWRWQIWSCGVNRSAMLGLCVCSKTYILAQNTTGFLPGLLSFRQKKALIVTLAMRYVNERNIQSMFADKSTSSKRKPNKPIGFISTLEKTVVEADSSMLGWTIENEPRLYTSLVFYKEYWNETLLWFVRMIFRMTHDTQSKKHFHDVKIITIKILIRLFSIKCIYIKIPRFSFDIFKIWKYDVWNEYLCFAHMSKYKQLNIIFIGNTKLILIPMQ